MQEFQILTYELDELLLSLANTTALNIVSQLTKKKADLTHIENILKKLSLPNIERKIKAFQTLYSVLNPGPILDLNDDQETALLFNAHLMEIQQDLKQGKLCTYPSKWNDFEANVLKNDIHLIQKIDSYKRAQFRRDKPLHSFYRNIFHHLLNTSQKSEFKKFFKATYVWLDFEEKASFSEDQLNLIDDFMLNFEKDHNLLILVRNVYNIFTNAEQGQTFEKFFPTENKWLNFESGADNITRFSVSQLNEIARLYKQVNDKEINFYQFLSTVIMSKEVNLSIDQKMMLIHTYSECNINYSGLKLSNIIDKKRERDIESKTSMPSSNLDLTKQKKSKKKNEEKGVEAFLHFTNHSADYFAAHSPLLPENEKRFSDDDEKLIGPQGSPFSAMETSTTETTSQAKEINEEEERLKLIDQILLLRKEIEKLIAEREVNKENTGLKLE